MKKITFYTLIFILGFLPGIAESQVPETLFGEYIGDLNVQETTFGMINETFYGVSVELKSTADPNTGIITVPYLGFDIPDLNNVVITPNGTNYVLTCAESLNFNIPELPIPEGVPIIGGMIFYDVPVVITLEDTNINADYVLDMNILAVATVTYLIFSYDINLNIHFNGSLYAPPTITTTSLPSGKTGTDYDATLEANGISPITWSITNGSLPDGLTLTNTGYIKGKPAVANTFNFTVKAANTSGSDTKALSIIITESAIAPAITTTILPEGEVDVEYEFPLKATGTAPVTWIIEEGKLPTGLELDTDSGIISGTPTEDGTFTFTVKATNSEGNDTKELFIVVQGVGIDEWKMKNGEVRIYPNPTTGELRVGVAGEIPCRSTGRNDIRSVEVFDLLGKRLTPSFGHLSPIWRGDGGEVDISHLPAGMYFVRIETENGRVVKKVVKE
jgi:hypothetical protein